MLLTLLCICGGVFPENVPNFAWRRRSRYQSPPAQNEKLWYYRQCLCLLFVGCLHVELPSGYTEHIRNGIIINIGYDFYTTRSVVETLARHKNFQFNWMLKWNTLHRNLATDKKKVEKYHPIQAPCQDAPCFNAWGPLEREKVWRTNGRARFVAFGNFQPSEFYSSWAAMGKWIIEYQIDNFLCDSKSEHQEIVGSSID